MNNEEEAELKDAALRKISDEYDADIFCYMGNLFPNHDREVLRLCRKRKRKRPNLLCILSTPGGSADSAYRISHCLQRSYSKERGGSGKFILYAPDFCKSAGTILALGADEIIMSQIAELGPIDVQLRKEEEVGEWASGLNATEALGQLQEQAISLFFDTFKRMRFDRELGFSTRVSTEVATNLAIGAMQPMYSQIDPVRLGELQRFVRISLEYGDRLATSNVKKGTIEKLVVGYPSHGFIIDRSEARQLFQRVSKPSDSLEVVGQLELNDALNAGAFEDERSKPSIRFVNDELKPEPESDDATSIKTPRKRKATPKRARSKASGERSDARRTNGRAS